MADPISKSTPLTWYVENVAAFSGFITVFAIGWLLFFIYRRSGSLLFLRDWIWRFFGGQPHFETERFERMRKDLRELEYYRYEFNIPANTLHDADSAEEWMYDNGFTPRDFGRVKRYIDWSDFTALSFITRKFAQWKINCFFLLTIVLLAGVAITPRLIESRYLMVSLKNSPEAPSFYISENNVKFGIWSDARLTIEQCRSSESLQAFILPDLPEEKLDIICSFFIDKNYSKYVQDGLSQQRGLLLWFVVLSMGGMIWLVILIARIEVARKLYKQWLAKRP
ncbi:DUF6216 family protein [Pseudomonas fluorescens]|uniref:DUF6216 family protein n=1 Tax=Pseudomonas fluorescens TaxID=294 RepID=UPI001BEBF122|nr:DUF6216 family protein [Pseudomonas fluorescens]MBT2374349.1 hypothetical protein [Pseudomonas fluorescens]